MILRADRANMFKDEGKNAFLISPLYVWLEIQGIDSVVGMNRAGGQAKPHPGTRIGFNFPLSILWVKEHVD